MYKYSTCCGMDHTGCSGSSGNGRAVVRASPCRTPAGRMPPSHVSTGRRTRGWYGVNCCELLPDSSSAESPLHSTRCLRVVVTDVMHRNAASDRRNVPSHWCAGAAPGSACGCPLCDSLRIMHDGVMPRHDRSSRSHRDISLTTKLTRSSGSQRCSRDCLRHMSACPTGVCYASG